MNNWGPDVQKKRAERDEVWDEMVRVVSIQRKNKEKEASDSDNCYSEFDD